MELSIVSLSSSTEKVVGFSRKRDAENIVENMITNVKATAKVTLLIADAMVTTQGCIR